MSTRLRLWVTSLIRRDRFEDELADELEFHLQARAEEWQARGLAPAEARRRARLEFGSLDNVWFSVPDLKRRLVPARGGVWLPTIESACDSLADGKVDVEITVAGEGAVAIARSVAVPEHLIGLTLVAVGTSLPELAAGIAAAVRGAPDLVFGNVVGSNIFNCLAVMGAASLAGPIAFERDVMGHDLWAMLAATALLIPVLVSGWRIVRLEAGLFLILYAGFIAYRFTGGPVGP